MAKFKRSKGKVKLRKRDFSWLWVIVALFIAVFAAVFWHVSASHNPPNLPNLKAAIVDQLYTDYPSENFTIEVKKTLEHYGFQVDVYQGNEVTVELYQKLPSYDYKLIILRTHSGMMHTSQGDITGVLFTNEPYTTVKYPLEQLFGDKLMMVQTSNNSACFFGIRPNFIIYSTKDNFRNTVVIVAGCAGLQDNILASAFTQKGASAFLAWNAGVNADYVDKATISLVENLLSGRRTLEKAVDATMATNGPDPTDHAVLSYFPPQSGDKTLRQLIQ